MASKTASIYALIDPVSEEIRYIGWATQRLKSRLSRHMSYAISTEPKRHIKTHRGSWLRSLNRESLTPRIELIQEVPFAQWAEAEKYWIGFFRAEGCPLTNGTSGGEGCPGHHKSQEVLDGVSRTHKGKIISEAHRQIVSKASRARWERWRAEGRSCSPETRQKCSDANRGRKHSGEALANMRASREPLKGVPRSPETIEKIRQALKGKPKSPEHRMRCLENLGIVPKETL